MNTIDSPRALLLQLLATTNLPEAEIVALLQAKAQDGAETRIEAVDRQPRPEPSPPSRSRVVQAAASPKENMTFWALSRVEKQATAPQDATAAVPKSLPKDYFKKGRPQTLPASPLWRSSQLRPPLLDLTRRAIPGAHIDSPQLVRQLSQGKMPKRFPCRKIKILRPDLWVVLDHRPVSALFRQDINRIAALLQTLIGPPGQRYLLISALFDTQKGYCLPIKKGIESVVKNFRDCPPGGCVLLVAPADTERVANWDLLSQAAKKRGTQLYWLNPLQPAATGLKTMIRYTERAVGGKRYDPGHLSALEFLLAAMAQCWEVCPGLLRALRHLLPLSLAPIAIEWSVWQSPDVLPTGLGVRVRPESLEQHQAHFRALSEGLQKAVLDLIVDAHQYWPAERRLWEKSVWAAQGVVEAQAMAQVVSEWQQLSTHLQSQLESGSGDLLPGWLLGAGERQPDEFWQSPVGQAMGQVVQLAATQVADAELPAGLISTGIPSSEKGEKQLRLYAHAEGLQLEPSHPPLASPLYTFQAGPLYQRQGKQVRRLTAETLISGEQTIEIQAPQQRVVLQALEKPAWARGIEQGPEGLYCTLSNGQRLRWCYPGEPFSGRLHPLATAAALAKAAWVNEAQWLALQGEGSSFYLMQEGRVETDSYGTYLDLAIKDVSVRLRWIPPGEFWMGSPEDEAERDEDEVRYRVVITQGYWLAETACDQSLWQAVMEENPCRFTGDDLLVETVSWEEVQVFCQRLNQQVPGLQARLPTEAEWEYGCRAGTKTVFWWGDTLNTAQANYDGSRPYHDGPKGEYRNRTIPVKQFTANPWGLYQVHGNVYEWCGDWYGAYDVSEHGRVDPCGPKWGSARVGRGGGWLSNGRGLRAAYRGNWLPGDRDQDLGFRLAAGPRPGGAEVKA